MRPTRRQHPAQKAVIEAQQNAVFQRHIDHMKKRNDLSDMPQDLEKLRERALKKEGGVIRRKISELEGKGIYEGWIAQAKAKGYPTFVMGDQLVLFFTPNGAVEQLVGPDVIKK